jgi:hypothetical protein
MDITKKHLSFAVDETVPASRFIVSLSDGTTVYENRPDNAELRTPWMRLKEYLKEEVLDITKIRFQGAGQTHNIPAADAYMVFYQANTGLYVGPEHFTCIGMFREDVNKLRVLFFNHLGIFHHEETRDCESNHPALIFVKS